MKPFDLFRRKHPGNGTCSHCGESHDRSSEFGFKVFGVDANLCAKCLRRLRRDIDEILGGQ